MYHELLDKLRRKAESYLSLTRKDYKLLPPDKVIEHNFELQQEAEKLCNMARLLPEGYLPIPQPQVFEIMKESHGIEYQVDKTRGVFSAKIPALLPKKETGSAKWIRGTVQATLREFVSDEEVEPFEGEYVIVFEHLYSHTRRRMRDHDNIELNVVLDSIALFLLTDDSAAFLDHFYTGRFAEEDATIITLMPRKQFVSYLLEKGDLWNEPSS